MVCRRGPSVVRGSNRCYCAAVGVIALWCVMGIDIQPLDSSGKALDLPESVVVEGALWKDVRENQERHARELDTWVQGLDPVLVQRATTIRDETDQALRRAIFDARFVAIPARESLQQRTAELLRDFPDPYAQGQILYSQINTLAQAGRGLEVVDSIEKARALPLWPNQQAGLHRIKGKLVFQEYMGKQRGLIPGEPPPFEEMRRTVATEYLKGIRVVLDRPFPRNLPDLQQPNAMERVQLPDDPVKKQQVLAAAEERKIVHGKAEMFLMLLRSAETQKTEMETGLIDHYTEEPRNPEELASLAAEILNDPQEEAKLMRRLELEPAEAATP